MWLVTVERNTVAWIQQFFIYTYYLCSSFHGSIKIFAENTFNLNGFFFFVVRSFAQRFGSYAMLNGYVCHMKHMLKSLGPFLKRWKISTRSVRFHPTNGETKCGETNVTFDLKQASNSVEALSFYVRQTAFFSFWYFNRTRNSKCNWSCVKCELKSWQSGFCRWKNGEYHRIDIDHTAKRWIMWLIHF